MNSLLLVSQQATCVTSWIPSHTPDALRVMAYPVTSQRKTEVLSVLSYYVSIIYFLRVCGKQRKNGSSLIMQSLLLIFAVTSVGLLLPSHSMITSYKWYTSMGYPYKVQHINQLSLGMLHQSLWLVLYFDYYCICVLSDNICLTLTWWIWFESQI